MYINSIGYYIPEKRVPNEHFLSVNGLTSEWIEQRTGIKTRSRAAEDENVDTMGIAAVENAIENAPYDVKDVDLIVAAHYCAYDTVATLAHKVQRHFAINGAKAVYASSACSSFINGLEIVEGYFAMGKAKRAILVCSEHNSYYSDESDKRSGHLWGDAAVAFLLSKEKECESDIKILNIYTEGLGDLGKGKDGVSLRPKEEGILMADGRDVFVHACRYMIHALKHSMAESGLEVKDIKKFIPHQANMRIIAQVAHQLDLPIENVMTNISELGNTGSASAPLLFALRRNEFSKGDKVALMVFGGGYSCGCFIIEN